jgi:hypothetical protein
LDGSGNIVDIKLPKKTPQGLGRPKGATNKPKNPTHTSKTPTGKTTKPKSTASKTNHPKSTTRDPSAFEYVEKKSKRELLIAAGIKRKKEREEKFKKRDKKEKKKKEKEEALRKKKESAAPIRTRPVRKAASISNPVPEPPPKKKLCAVQIASSLPITPTEPKGQTTEPQSPEEEPAPPLPLREAWEDSYYMKALPEIVLDYVNTTLNVDSDGHCGF